MTDSEHGAGHNQTPEESATIYSSVGIQGAKYRDFSASRREARAQLRQRSLGAEPARKAAEQVPLVVSALDVEPRRQAEAGAASHWFALQGIFAPAGQTPETAGSVRSLERLVPAVTVFSVAGGVGKTSLVATLGRVLAAYGEQVLLVETASLGLLPLFFGSREFKPGFNLGMVRTFSPPHGSTDAPVQAVMLDAEQYLQQGGDDRNLLPEVLLRNANASNRILIDVQTASRAVAQSLLPLAATVLAPLLPDMNSVVSVASVEAVFAGRGDSGGRPIKPIYLLNQFDPSLPLHQDVRAILQQQLGSRLLPFVLRRSPAVSEALAEGMTVMDYAPNSSVVEDYVQLANWLGSVSPVATASFRRVRWSER